MRPRTGSFALVTLALVLTHPALVRRAVAGDAQQAVMQEILDVLRQNQQITDEQHRDLSRKVRQAGEADRAAAQARTVEKVERVEAVQDIQTGGPVERVEKVEVVEEKKPAPDTLRAYWKDGPRFETADKSFRLGLIGRIQNDWAIIDSSRALRDELGIDAFQSGTEFRRARIGIEGDVYGDFAFKFEVDFAGGEVAFKDMYLAARNVPYIQNVRVGHFKEPFSLEQLTSSVNITFMERSLADVFTPERNTGIAIHPTYFDERLTWSVGAFRETDDSGTGFGDKQNYDIATRLTGLPWYADDGAQLVHLGFSYVHSFRNGVETEIRQRPESHLAERFVDTGPFLANDNDRINPELAVVYGPASLQAEYMRVFVDAPEVDDPAFDGWYAYLSYFLTGEHRAYKTSAAAFDRVRPKRNFGFGPDAGWGAFEVGARYSKIELDSGDVQGGNLGDTTLGLNWYLNPNMRIMANYVYSARTDTAGSANIYQSRFQIVW
ncbi:MAG: porin [Thermodesulfobacteriota bacterium]